MYLYFWVSAHREKNDTQVSDLHYLEKDLITCSLDKYLLNELDEWIPQNDTYLTKSYLATAFKIFNVQVFNYFFKDRFSLKHI